MSDLENEGRLGHIVRLAFKVAAIFIYILILSVVISKASNFLFDYFMSHRTFTKEIKR